jgi:hypothetical protein
MNGTSSEQLACVYRISPDDVIEFVNASWQRFAVENGTSTLSHDVIGTSLWKYISGHQIVQLSKELLARVRETRCEVTIPFRCDSPTMRRFMRMKIAPLSKGRVEYITWAERETPLTKPIKLLDPAVPKDQERFLRMCAWCKKVHGEDSWLEIEEAITRLRLFDSRSTPAITHGICESCFKMMAN